MGAGSHILSDFTWQCFVGRLSDNVRMADVQRRSDSSNHISDSREQWAARRTSDILSESHECSTFVSAVSDISIPHRDVNEAGESEAEARTLEVEAEAWTLEAEAWTLEAEARTLEAEAEAWALEAKPEAWILETECTFQYLTFTNANYFMIKSIL